MSDNEKNSQKLTVVVDLDIQPALNKLAQLHKEIEKVGKLMKEKNLGADE